MNRGRPGGGENGDGPFMAVSMGTSPATHSRRLVVIRVIRGQPLLAKLDELPQHMLGATMAMLNVLILGKESSEATSDVTDIYPWNTSTGSGAEGIQGSASLSPRRG